VWFAAVLISLGSCRGVGAGEPQAKTIALANCGAVTADVMEQARQFAEKQLRVPVRSLDATAVNAPDLQGSIEQVAKLKAANDVCLVALVSPGKTCAEHVRVEPKLSVAVVNATAFTDADPKKSAARLRKAALRATAFLFGIRPAPDPRCVTHQYRTLEDFDSIGVNLCPPWQVRFEEEAQQRGLVVKRVSREAILKARTTK